jgi:hypothetical protein
LPIRVLIFAAAARLNHPVSVLLPHGVAGERAGLAGRRREQPGGTHGGGRGEHDCSAHLPRHPGQLDPIDDVMGWTLDGGALCEIDRIISDTIKDPVGPEFMAPPARNQSIAQAQRKFGVRDASAGA